MTDLTAQRTLVKSPPELWSELSEIESLAKHLGQLGEIRITRVEPETTVAWEGEQISGTVELEQSGWGTRVTFRATVPEPDPPPAIPAPAAEPQPIAEASQLEQTTDPESVVVAPEPTPATAPEPSSGDAEPVPAPKRGGFLTRWLFRERRPTEREAAAALSVAPSTEPAPPVPEAAPAAAEPTSVELAAVVMPTEPAQETAEAQRVQAVLDGTLEALGQAHHRPFSRG